VDEDIGHRRIPGDRRQELLQCVDAACGRADADDRLIRARTCLQWLDIFRIAHYASSLRLRFPFAIGRSFAEAAPP
jgi:hypothetical protein